MSNYVWIVDEPGGAFRKTEFPMPVLQANQVLVKIHASGLNPLDTKIRRGEAAHAQQPRLRRGEGPAQSGSKCVATQAGELEVREDHIESLTRQ